MKIFDIFRKKQSEPEPRIIYPGEIHVDRNWQDDPATDTTVITIGGQVHPEHLEAIKAILRGEVHVTRFPGGKVKTKRAVGGAL